MTNKLEGSRPDDMDEKIKNKLDEAYELAEQFAMVKTTELPSFAHKLSPDFISALEHMAKNCEKASGGFSNLLTGLSIKAVCGATVDVRYHQVQIQSQTDRPAGFNFRGVSEGVIYVWMTEHEFHCAKSGWQTRTFERPKPYLLNYDENIGYIKDAFLKCYDQIETHSQDPLLALAFLLWRRIQLREGARINLAKPKVQDVLRLTNLFQKHFFYPYKNSKGASRLPVLALHAIYSLLVGQLRRFEGKHLKALELHSAADSQTGAVGDVEVVCENGDVYEAVEIKHGIQINKAIVEAAKQKIRGSQIDRYYILTTHSQHEPDEEVAKAVEQVKNLLGTQMIVNGVIPSIKYYLRLLENPGGVIQEYVKRLEHDESVEFEHKDIWNKIATGDV